LRLNWLSATAQLQVDRPRRGTLRNNYFDKTGRGKIFNEEFQKPYWYNSFQEKIPQKP
jgi:hypothetical protein